ncbi:PIN domain-containing protein [Flavobacterium okayamense]|uniref:PIN domain-containing protein n=1 Tax=Flavobacterium okayamense TaxID=2830782 RepID=A0ABM7S4D7_9FLAO|nr:PIN domain-containing protein [Flavobacterium okayamense]BCY28376.1 hypothetical protein KK2020170_12440 [Flavobacterium okayamense]
MPNIIIPFDNYEFKANKTYFFDNNIWISLFAPLINTNSSQQAKSSSFLKQIYSYNSQIVTSSLILSEFSNRYLRFDFEQWKKQTGNYSANFKSDYKTTSQYKLALSEVKLLVKKIISLDLVERYPDSFNSVNFDNILDNFEIDFNDAYYLEQCSNNNWILVTSDNDFDNTNSNIIIVKI